MRNWVEDIQAVFGDMKPWELDGLVRQAEMFQKAQLDGEVLLWSTNQHTVPSDIVELWAALGLVTDSQVAATAETRAVQTKERLTKYVEERNKHGYSAEEMFEMRAAFGPGETVVDVFTGRKITL